VPLLLLAIFASTWLALASVDAHSRVAVAWPAAGLVAGLLLVCPPAQRRVALAASTLLVLLALLLHGYPPAVALAFSLICAASAWTVRWRLHRHLDKPRVGLLVPGDVSRLLASVTLGAGVAAAGVAVTVGVAHRGDPLLAAVACFGTYAAALMVLLPLFVEAPQFPPLADPRERLVQSVLTLGITVLVFLIAGAPPVVFAVMPMFAWLAFRGTLREASLLLVGVGAVATTMTAFHVGPVWGLRSRYDISPELAGGFLQLFLIDCALLLLPLSVMVNQQRFSATRAESQARTLQRLVSAATGTAVVATDAEGRIAVFNPGAEVVLGLSAGQVVGTLPDHLFPAEELARQAERLGTSPAFADLCTAMVDRDEAATLWQFRRGDGEERALRMTVTAVHDDHGAPAGHLCIADDVTEREAAHRALVTALEHERSAVDRLRELERVKADFVATVSHELRTPITSMNGYLELLQDGAVGELTADQRELVGRVERNGRRLQLLVEDLLMLSQVEVRGMTMNPVETDLREAVRGAYDALEPGLAGRTLAVVLVLPSDPVLHQGDPDQLERMVLNLLSNALKFTPDGGRVEVSLTAGGESSEIVVRDTGIGIPEREQPQLFTRFFRSSLATEHAVQGAGLGLTIVRAIVGQHGGDIAVVSTEGRGTTVTVRLPQRAPAPSGAVGATT
jgi:PAS domain S-box-containing protein